MTYANASRISSSTARQAPTIKVSSITLPVSHMQQALNKARGIKEDIIKELQDYTVHAVVY
ncbi:hypothetical protein [Listeria monocytogenes]|uniref:hypothetical protein n=1 Tax=Listeria monocytogenes TaxID=1639 RepID=UPI0011D1A72A|nr:hypothetical protein [Listeria monocytogenes]